ncbi:MAG: phenylalanine 4-monooxygenase, partial [Deltaproteobacteria bacterium]|nr:phenylalanine 4-monooxygenase [Deltaproteobacteria bacterium]
HTHATTTQEPIFETGVELELCHPGHGDPAYLARREAIFALSQLHRVEGLEPPVIQYTEEENSVWETVTRKLAPLHERFAASCYLRGKERLNIPTSRVPQLAVLSAELQHLTGIGLVSAEGAIPFKRFFTYLADGRFPCTQFLRHASKPEFTPEPDMTHDLFGHVPPLADAEYVEIICMLGRATKAATPEQALKLKHFSWFSIEFGLIEEQNETRILGAGILSSIGEIPFSLSSEVERRPFRFQEVIETPYDVTRMQNLLFTVKSLSHLRNELQHCVQALGIAL